jgi:hypothetical protein
MGLGLHPFHFAQPSHKRRAFLHAKMNVCRVAFQRSMQSAIKGLKSVLLLRQESKLRAQPLLFHAGQPIAFALGTSGFISPTWKESSGSLPA